MDTPDITPWLNLLTQGTRFITFDSPAVDGLMVERLDGREGINEDFRFELDLVSTSAFLDPATWIGQRAHVALARAEGGRRHWHGYITRSASLGADGGLARYRVTLQSALAFPATRRNTLIFQDKTALEVIEQVFDDHPQLAWRNDSTASLRRRPVTTQYRETDLDFVCRLLGEEGLSWRIEHDQGGSEDHDDGPGHTVVVFDPEASLSLPDGTPGTLRFHRVDATERDDALTVFGERRQLVPDQLTTSSWAADQVQAVTGTARAAATEGAAELPGLDIFEADRAQRFDDPAQAERHARHRLDAQRLLARHFVGQGAARGLEAGKAYTLIQHPDLDGQRFVPLWITHHATNNLGTDLPQPDGTRRPDDLGKGSYRQRFLAVPADTRIAPEHQDKPLAPGCDTAVVVGVPGEALTATRDHQVRIQFFWQRGTAPLPGGLTDTGSKSNPEGHAPGDHHSGTWVRVAEAAAGAHHGASFMPRIGDEVLVEYAHGDIDQPVVVGQLYNGTAAMPFAAGEGSGANHPGTLSGIHTHTTDGEPSASWVLDDASGQLRHRVGHAIADSRLELGHLIDQHGAQRGAFRGEGFELITDGWAVARAGEGLLASATARHEARSTQMDSTETRGQLKAAAATAQRLDRAAGQAGARGLAATSAHADLARHIDPEQDGKYTGKVGGQDPTRPANGKRHGGDPVERFAAPLLFMETPESLILTSPGDSASFAGRHHHLTSQRDTHLAAGTSLAAAAGAGAGLYTAEGGLKAIANHGPVSIEAHTDAMEILADDSVSVTSTEARIDVLAKNKIVLRAGQSIITLDGQNLTIACPGTLTVKSTTHNWLGGGGQAAELPELPTDTLPLTTLKLDHRYHDNSPIALASYEAKLSDGSIRKGKLDTQGKATIENVPMGGAEVRFSPSGKVYQPDNPTTNPAYKAKISKRDLGALVERYFKPDPSDA